MFCEVGADFGDGVAVILQKYPEDFNDQQALKSIVQFTFPCGLHRFIICLLNFYCF